MAQSERTADELVADLHLLGVTEGDHLMVHASMSNIGPVMGGAAGVVAALDAAVGARGTVIMVLGSIDDGKPFDALLTPADPDVGVLAEVLRTTPGTLVSDHPEGRFAARGALASHFTADVPWHDYYGPGSPLERLVESGGRVLRLGADPDTVTLIHDAEYIAALPDKRRVRRERLLAGSPDGHPAVVECLDDSNGIVARDGEDYFTTILREYFATGSARHGIVGRASSDFIDAPHLVAFSVGWIEQHLG